jgi:hypothetical protein
VSEVHDFGVESGSHRPVVSLHRSPVGQPVARHPAEHWPPSTQIMVGGLQSKSVRHPLIAMQRPDAASQAVPAPQAIELPGVAHPGTQVSSSQTAPGEHIESAVHSGCCTPESVGHCAFDVHSLGVLGFAIATHSPPTHDSPGAQSDAYVQPYSAGLPGSVQLERNSAQDKNHHRCMTGVDRRVAPSRKSATLPIQPTNQQYGGRSTSGCGGADFPPCDSLNPGWED